MISGMPTLVDFGVDLTARQVRLSADEFIGANPVFSVEVYGQPLCKHIDGVSTFTNIC